MRQRHAIAFACLGVVAMAVGCFDFGELSGTSETDGEAGAAGDAAQDGALADQVSATDAPEGDAAPSNGCPYGKGPPMVRVPTVSGNTYCIDATEVTRAQYKLFLDANVDPTSQDSVCAFNATFTPDQTQASCPSSPFDPSVHPNWPVTCVNWCDAKAYCAWAGKRMCGRIDSDGGLLSLAQAAGTLDEWYSACSDGGELAYPYGNTYSASACKGAENTPSTLIDVGSLTTCSGGYAGISDMSGNAWEYENGCGLAATGDAAATRCFRRGGSFEELSGQLTCGSVDQQPRSGADSNSGFRCCAE